jgi:hypothetical protein
MLDSRSKAASTVSGRPSNDGSDAPGAGSSSASVQEAITRVALPGKSTRCCIATKPPNEWPSSVHSSSSCSRTNASSARAAPENVHSSGSGERPLPGRSTSSSR